VSTFDFVRSAASETALRKILFPPKMMNCLEGLTLRSGGAADRPLAEERRRKASAIRRLRAELPRRLSQYGARKSSPLHFLTKEVTNKQYISYLRE